MDYEDIIFDRKDGVATITLNRPDRLNAYTRRMGQELVSAIEAAKADDEARVLVITGAGRGFCAGVDVSPTEASTSTTVRRDTFMGPVVRGLQALDKPVIAAINGVAAGAGLSMALACDIRIASDKARFSQAYVRLGLVPGNGATYFLPRLVGIAKALELMWTSRIIEAEEAERIGLVNSIVPHDDLMTATRELATNLAKGPSIAIQLTKLAAYRGLTAPDLASHLVYELHFDDICLATEDSEEGRRAFQEKREPVFKGK